MVPASTADGGIKNYFLAMQDQFTLPVEYIYRGARNWPYRASVWQEIKRFFSDIRLLVRKLDSEEIFLLQTNTSLGYFSVIRDGIFQLIAKKRGLKTIVFFRGWDTRVERFLEKYLLPLFKYSFFKADTMIVLANPFKSKLKELGYQGDIRLETTIVDDELLQNFSLNDHLNEQNKRRKNKQLNILFLARVEKAKGIYEAIDAVMILRKINPGWAIQLTVAGKGKELDNVQEYLKEKNILNISFPGYVENDSKASLYSASDIYLFPTYTEGMPNSVLEAMAFGLPVITRGVGAIPDILNQSENGFYTDSKNPEIFAQYIQKLINDPELSNRISQNNHTKAMDNYILSKVVKRVEKIYTGLLNEAIDTTA